MRWSSTHPAQLPHGPPTHALSRSTSTVLSAPSFTLTVWRYRVFQSLVTADTSAAVPASFQPRTLTCTATRVVSSATMRSHFTSPDGSDTKATRPESCVSPTFVRTRSSSVYPVRVTNCGTSV